MALFEDDFMDDLQYFIVEYKDQFPSDLVTKYNLTSPDEVITIVTNASQGNKENGLNRLQDVRNYLIDLRTDLSNYYGLDDDYDKQEEMMQILNRLIRDVKPKKFAKMHDIVTPGEMIGLRSVARQKDLPREMEGEIIDYVGTTPRGGRRKRKTVKNRRNKRKTRHNRSMRKRRYKS